MNIFKGFYHEVAFITNNCIKGVVIMLEPIIIILLITNGLLTLYNYIKKQLEGKQKKVVFLIKFIFSYVVVLSFTLVSIVYITGNLVDLVDDGGIRAGDVINSIEITNISQMIFLAIFLIGAIREMCGKKNNRIFSIVYWLSFVIFLGFFLSSVI